MLPISPAGLTGGGRGIGRATAIALAREVAGDGIRVYAVCPGGVNTKMHRDIFPDTDPRSLLQPEAVARVIVDLATGRRRASSERQWMLAKRWHQAYSATIQRGATALLEPKK